MPDPTAPPPRGPPRLAVFKAAADLAISAFGGRQELYERFYGGDPFALRSSFWFNQVDWSGPDRLVDDCLAAFDVQTALKATQSQ